MCRRAALALLLASLPLTAAPVLRLPFDGELQDLSGRGNDAYSGGAKFAAGQAGQALNLLRQATVPDSAELRLAPGLLIDCWVKYNVLPGSFQTIVSKDRNYMLRINQPAEGRSFAFFIWLGDNWETRVNSTVVPQVGEWYHLVASWDGQLLKLDVNGTVTTQERTGKLDPSDAPVVLGPYDGWLDELTITNPGAQSAGVAHWSFDGNLTDDTGHGHDLTSETPAKYAKGRLGQAIALGPTVQTPSTKDLQLAAGLRIDCSVYFDELPTDYTYLVQKEGAYMLRVDNEKEGRWFSFFVNVDGFEPRVRAAVKADVGKWYRLVAKWDGMTLSLDVNGDHQQVARSGRVKPNDSPLTLGPIGGRIDDLRIENPQLPVLRVKSLTQEHTLLSAGRDETLTAVVENVGSDVTGVSATLVLGDGVECLGPALQTAGDLASGDSKSLTWTVRSAESRSISATLQLSAGDYKALEHRRWLAFLSPSIEPILPQPVTGGGQTWYIDSVGGSNAKAGTSEASAWLDFTKINGQELGPGDRLLLKRGSVFTQELNLTASGTIHHWAEIGTYGEGPRPVLRRNWDIGERCVLVTDPDYLLIHGLVVCYAGKGLICNYRTSGHRGLVIEDCVAHHIEGLYRQDANGIPEWLGRTGAPGDGLHSSAGFAAVGAQPQDVVLRDLEMFQCSWGYFVLGDNVVVDRVYCHDEHVHNTSPHPAMVQIRRAFLTNSIHDASGWHASAGTMGIMLVDPQGMVIRNCFWLNQPDSGSHDEGGIDFEARGDGCLIDRCTFQHNAGAAIEVLGLRSPQVRNLEITNSRFIENNLANKLGPGEVFIWGRTANAEVVCSTGSIHNNGYVLHPGVEFYVNEKPQLTDWKVYDNTEYKSVAELKQAMPFNDPPEINAGQDVWSDRPTVKLTGQVTDDGRPAGKRLLIRWEQLEGPGIAKFQDASQAATTATFSAPGDYLLRLVADDGELWLSDQVVVHVLPAGASTLAAWDFNGIEDKEGWTEVNPGTKLVEYPHPLWSTRSEPVKYVAGGFYILAIQGSPDCHLLSGDNLNLDLSKANTIRLRLMNHTPATEFRLRFTTAANPTWSAKQSVTFKVTPNDDAPRVYTVKVPGWSGKLKQLRLELATGQPLTGTCRLDYVWVGAER